MRQENWEVYPTLVIPSPVIAKTVSFSGSRGESVILAIRRSPLDFRRYTRVCYLLVCIMSNPSDSKLKDLKVKI